MNSFASFHYRLWAWSGLLITRVVQFTGWWMGVALVSWLSGITLAPVLIIGDCVIKARAGTLGFDEIFRAFLYCPFSVLVICYFPPSTIWGLIKDLWHGLPFILNILSIGFFRVAQRSFAKAMVSATGLPANCKVQRVQTPTGPGWGVVQRRDGERWARVIATGASRDEARQKARKYFGLA